MRCAVVSESGVKFFEHDMQRGRHIPQINDEVLSLSAWVIYEGSCEANQLGARVLGELGFEPKAYSGSILLMSSTPDKCFTADEADYILSVAAAPSFADQLWVDTRGHSSGGSDEFDPDEDGDSSFSSSASSFDKEEESAEISTAISTEISTASQYLLNAPLEKKSKYK